MKKSRFSEHKIMSILKQGEGGVPVAELCREHWHEFGKFLQVALEIWWHGHLDDGPHERAGGGK